MILHNFNSYFDLEFFFDRKLHSYDPRTLFDRNVEKLTKFNLKCWKVWKNFNGGQNDKKEDLKSKNLKIGYCFWSRALFLWLFDRNVEKHSKYNPKCRNLQNSIFALWKIIKVLILTLVIRPRVWSLRSWIVYSLLCMNNWQFIVLDLNEA